MSTLVDALRSMVEAVPPGGAVIRRDWLAAQLEGEGGGSDSVGEPLVDLTVEDVAAERSASESTVRGWLAEGLSPRAEGSPALADPAGGCAGVLPGSRTAAVLASRHHSAKPQQLA